MGIDLALRPQAVCPWPRDTPSLCLRLLVGSKGDSLRKASFRSVCDDLQKRYFVSSLELDSNLGINKMLRKSI